jgi:uncharacterized repeat protein (TIGR01451 family)
MNRKARLLGYLLVFSALAALLLAIPSAWATPEQGRVAQTVPTRTSEPPPESDDEPQATEQPPAQPTDLPTVLPGTPAPTLSVTTPATRAAGAKLVLRKEVAPAVAWPGATLVYTLTLSNQGTLSAQQIVVQDTLPADLVPGAIAPGPDARWEGQTLQVQAPSLPPGSQLVIAYTAEVRVDTRPGGVISNGASAAAAGNLRVAANTSVRLPPAELPTTGGFFNGIPGTAGCGR